MIRPASVRAFVALVRVLALLLLTSGSARAQMKAPASAPAAVASEKTAEEEAPDSPRASMRSFFDLAQRGRYDEAAIYLDVPHGSEKRAGELASQLHAVISQRLLVNPETLSPLARGRPTDGLAAGIEELGKIADAKNHPIPIRLVRHESKAADDEARWVFSQTTVAAVPALYGSLRDRWIRERLPPVLLTQGPMALSFWQWLALPILAAVCIALGRILCGLSGIVAKRLVGTRKWSTTILAHLKAPTTVGWAIALFALSTPYLALTLRADDLIERGLRALAYLTLFWALLRVVSIVGNEVTRSDWVNLHPSARSLSTVAMSLGRVIVATLALMVALSELGYPVTSIIAGLGIGGVALALAAQKTVENLFGSISILVDQPFRVGDTIRVDTIEGSVERIGLRSTRVRTAERTLVIFPNGKLADMRIESLGPRDRMRFAMKLQLARSASTVQIRSVSEKVKETLGAHALVRKQDVSVRLAGIGEASYDIEVNALIETLDSNEYARVREELLVAFVETVEKAGVKLAVPVRLLVAPANGASGAGGASLPSANP